VILISAFAECGAEVVTMVICPECESDLDIEEDEVDEGEVVTCPECGTDFEVVAVEPLELSRVDEEAIDDEEEEVAEEEEEE
jgi:alpha-aminoadipate carrier protein LysW